MVKKFIGNIFPFCNFAESFCQELLLQIKRLKGYKTALSNLVNPCVQVSPVSVTHIDVYSLRGTGKGVWAMIISPLKTSMKVKGKLDYENLYIFLQSYVLLVEISKGYAIFFQSLLHIRNKHVCKSAVIWNHCACRHVISVYRMDELMEERQNQITQLLH